MSERLKNAGLTPDQMLVKIEEFMHKIQRLTNILGVDMRAYQADHIAIRINDQELAMLAHQAWGKLGKEISNTEINGRPIIVIEFDQPMVAGPWTIECLELPYPAEGKQYATQSWEHIEFVVPCDVESAEAYKEALLEQWPELAQRWDTLEDSGVKTKLSSPKGEGERLSNPTVAFKHEGICIKVHPHSLKDIVDSEQLA